MKIHHLMSVPLGLVLFSQLASAGPPLNDVVFATVDGHKLQLDIFLPKNVDYPPLVVFIHGGGWRNGDYKRCHTRWLTDYGFAVASIGYRLTDKTTFPGQIHDCKGAVRWLRAHAKDYGYDADRIGVAGTSAGGHLAALLGVSGGMSELEGHVGGNSAESSRIQAVVDYYGPSDFLLRSEHQPEKTEKPTSPVWLLLGGAVSKNRELARLASPASHVTRDDAPLLIIHGDSDRTVNLRQSQRIAREYQATELDVTLEVLKGAGHGGSKFFQPEQKKLVVDFLQKHLRSAENSGS